MQYPQFDPYVGPEGGYFIAPTVETTEERVESIYVDQIDGLLERHDL